MSERAVFLALNGGLLIAFTVWLVLPPGSSWLLHVLRSMSAGKDLVIRLGLEPFAHKPDSQPMVGGGDERSRSIYGHRGMQGVSRAVDLTGSIRSPRLRPGLGFKPMHPQSKCLQPQRFIYLKPVRKIRPAVSRRTPSQQLRPESIGDLSYLELK